MAQLTDIDRTFLRTALKSAQQNDVPAVGVRTELMERLLAYLAELERTRSAPQSGSGESANAP